MTYSEQLATLTTDPPLGAQVAPICNLEASLKWATTASIAFAGIVLVKQAEYIHDLCLLLPDARWLVSGVPWFGELVAVDSWDPRPSTDELLARRVELSWKPTRSLLKKGPKVLADGDANSGERGGSSGVVTWTELVGWAR